MMFYQLPPAGTPVSLSVQPDLSLPEFLLSPSTRFYTSGTAALAMALKAAMKAIPVDTAEILLPAYGCPDLVSAVLHVGAKPVLVDLQADRPWLDLVQLEKAININTVAIIGVNLFGISERWAQLRELVVRAKIILIEDSAQYFPGIDEQENWHGDLVVFSFGRGKPISLLGGGAVYTRRSDLYDVLPDIRVDHANLWRQMSFTLKVRLYNAMILPYLYWLPQSLPFLHLGETRYHALLEIKTMDSVRKKLLSANVLRYQSDYKAIQRRDDIAKMLDSVAGVVNLSRVCDMPADRRLLRYPILVKAGSRDALYQKLKRAGLGVSIMYPASLSEVEGLEHLFTGQEFPQAMAFASRLITLPVHVGVSVKDIKKMAFLLESSLTAV